jgi:hypothetical protein
MHDEDMPSDRVSLLALRGQIADRDGTVETELPQNRTAHRRENLRAALALIDDLTGRHAAPSAISARFIKPHPGNGIDGDWSRLGSGGTAGVNIGGPYACTFTREESNNQASFLRFSLGISLTYNNTRTLSRVVVLATY